MELCEKLRELRTVNNLTQEQLAEKLYVSRTAVSKWESGRGIPNIDSLKAISKLFNVSIDSLLSGDELIKIAADENKNSKIKKNYVLYGVLDFLAVFFIFLPIYGEKDSSGVHTFSIWGYIDYSFTGSIFFALISVIVLIGISEVILEHFELLKAAKTVSTVCFILEIAAILLFIAANQPYAASFLIALTLIKAAILFDSLKRKG